MDKRYRIEYDDATRQYQVIDNNLPTEPVATTTLFGNAERVEVALNYYEAQ